MAADSTKQLAWSSFASLGLHQAVLNQNARAPLGRHPRGVISNVASWVKALATPRRPRTGWFGSGRPEDPGGSRCRQGWVLVRSNADPPRPFRPVGRNGTNGTTGVPRVSQTVFFLEAGVRDASQMIVGGPLNFDPLSNTTKNIKEPSDIFR